MKTREEIEKHYEEKVRELQKLQTEVSEKDFQAEINRLDTWFDRADEKIFYGENARAFQTKIKKAEMKRTSESKMIENFEKAIENIEKSECKPGVYSIGLIYSEFSSETRKKLKALGIKIMKIEGRNHFLYKKIMKEVKNVSNN
ncbi:MAG: hypothetical protein ABIJ17_02385 [Patescibacteria group bacterium]